jgi:signal transduction histidine kinase
MSRLLGITLKQRYTLALSIIALLAIASQFIIQITAMKGESDSRIVNIAGRQRMLSQRINKCVLGIYGAENIQIRQQYKDELEFSSTLWETSHEGLQSGDAGLGLPGDNSPEIKTLFAGINGYHQTILSAAKRIIERSSDDNLQSEMQSDIALIRDSEMPFLKGMDAIVFQYDKEAKDRINVIKQIEFGILLVTLLVLALEARFIFMPADRKIREDMDSMRNSEEELRRLFDAKTQLLIEQQELIKKLEDAQGQLLQSEKMASVGQLAAGVAHEINNPIGFVNSNLCSLKGQVNDLLSLIAVYERAETALDGRLDLLEAIKKGKSAADLDFLRGDIQNLIAESLDGVDRVKRIVDNLKDFSRVDSTEWEYVNLENGLESTLNIVWNEIKYKAEVKKEYARLPEIECIASQLNQVFMNLLINAAHAIEDRGLIILRTGFDDAEVWVEVEDTGKGIKPEHLNRIFDPFFTTKPVGKGTGLGLSLAYGIAQRHHGRLEVRSEVDKGAVFRLTLPRTRVA